MAKTNSRSSLRDWQLVYEALSDDLHDLERIAEDPGTAEDVREMAISQLAEAKQDLSNMTMRRGGSLLTDA